KQPSRSFLNTHHRQIPPHPTKGSEANELAQNNKDFFNKISPHLPNGTQVDHTSPIQPQTCNWCDLPGERQAGQPLQIPIVAVGPPQTSPAISCLSASPTPAHAVRYSNITRGVRKTCI
ncbi:hypothetical protein, partial [Actibacterium sp. 188UL27-1]|uniref:hypothetical protein n=1 Tax=Actibacterium sp. 188UL27-1 TaxID=2786961 RepID=UPI001959A6D5